MNAEKLKKIGLTLEDFQKKDNPPIEEIVKAINEITECVLDLYAMEYEEGE